MGISVVIPAYNCAAYLPECLDSVLAQTVAVDEIIVVDDGSTDGTAALLQQQYPMVRCIGQSNAGASAARNTGIKAARHELIALGDADDVWHPRRIEYEMDAMDSCADVDLVGCTMLRFGRSHELRWPEVHAPELLRVDLALTFRWGGSLPVQTWLVKREVFDEAGLLDTALPVAEDIDILLRVLALGIGAVSVRARLYGWRAVPTSLSSTSAPEYPICHYRVLSRYRPDDGDGPHPLSCEQYWGPMARWLASDMLSAIAHGRWEDAREIASEIGRAPRSRLSPRARQARLIARIVTGTRSRRAQTVLSAGVRATSRATRWLRGPFARRRYRV